MKDTEQRILARQVGRTLTHEEMEKVNGSEPSRYNFTTHPFGQAPDSGGGIDYERSF